ncbi:CdaR family transcriptional regulator [Thermomonospora sp. CIF 1]|uniref:Putative transcriptional regulator, PucR family n=1 Tax=Thermomonospora curvata (strain ATCC 19995 / DSM 43183 / JCM 3096 / KCTC 9072 / NBRC 15933 / NCIMB 10081 / Henssen B9) TaxID=471852 RepID=D1A6A3_THECD|nr:helix-turn-helix domain-containing protein [Thermomonospora sp. CIF 1]ACZ00202.1 putative transcriptional regulator, PucR family [Thermomonospora curvata DSM 43183]PKK12012.1 MAG: PucR family transcriptional regulator [Thermomonospora sp. CIF 1]
MGALTTSPEKADRVIIRRAVRKLADRLPQLADRLVNEILAGEGQDRPAELRADLWELSHIGLGHGIEAILDPSRGRADLRWAEELGRRRAEQGLPLDQLLRSYRLAGCVFWEALVEAVSEENPEHVPLLVRNATLTWHTIDQQSTAAAEAYHRTEYELLRRSEERVQAIVDALLEGRGTDPGLLPAATRALGLPAQGRYAVVVIDQGEVLGGRGFSRPTDGGGLRFIWRMRADTQIAVVDLGNADLDDLVEVLRPRVYGHAGISPVVEALADLGKARWLAELALRTCREPGAEIARLDRRLPDALVVSQPELAERLGRGVLGAFSQINPAFRDVLISTLATWLECDGSASKAAGRLYCHHNTVLNRLRRIEQLTGRSLNRPRELVEVVLALSALKLVGRPDDGRP